MPVRIGPRPCASLFSRYRKSKLLLVVHVSRLSRRRTCSPLPTLAWKRWSIEKFVRRDLAPEKMPMSLNVWKRSWRTPFESTYVSPGNSGEYTMFAFGVRI